jgi:DNA-binding GntR family transcriptional regulator
MSGIVDRTIAELRSLLLAGNIAPGERLAEIPLATRLGVSRPTMREALRAVQATGLASGDGRGLTVPVVQGADLRAVLLARAGLEGLHAELAALRVRSGEVAPAQLRYLTERRRAASNAVRAGQRRRLLLEDRSLHQAIDALALSPVGSELLDRLWDRLVVATGREGPDPGAFHVERDAEHQAIVAAIEGGRPKRARAAATDHVMATIAARGL